MGILADFFELQKLDSEILQLRKEQKRLPRKLALSKQKIDKQKQVLIELIERIKHNKVRIMDEESKLGTLDANTKKKQVQLNQVKTNREYSTILQEIEQGKATQEQQEEAILNLMEENEGEVKAQQQQQQKIMAMEAEHNDYAREVQQALQQIQGELEVLLQQREKQRGVIVVRDEKTLETYDRVLNAKNGPAMVAVEEDACGFCHGQLLANEMAAVIAGKIVFCKDCSRLLYLWHKLH